MAWCDGLRETTEWPSAGTSFTPTRISRGRWRKRSRIAPRRVALSTFSTRCCADRRGHGSASRAQGASRAQVLPGLRAREDGDDRRAFLLIKNTPKVTGFLGSDNKAIPITDDEAMRILHQVKEGVERPKPMVTFEVGEQVRVADGRLRPSRDTSKRWTSSARASRSPSQFSAGPRRSNWNSARWRRWPEASALRTSRLTSRAGFRFRQSLFDRTRAGSAVTLGEQKRV